MKMFRYLKIVIRKLIPSGMQVPLKYWYSSLRGYSEPEMSLLKYLVKSETMAIDIGGNRGIYSYHISKFCRNIEIFEPNPVCFKILRAWSSKKSAINVHDVALSHEAGSAELLIPIDKNGVEHDSSGSIENNNFSKTRSETVPLKSLDSYAFKLVDFIKIDVEGHEFSLLKGSVQTIEASKPAMLIEIEQRHNKVPIGEIFSYIENLGYNSYYLDEGALHDASHFDLSLLQAEANLTTSNKYINNFLFLHRARLNAGEYKAFPGMNLK